MLSNKLARDIIGEATEIAGYNTDISKSMKIALYNLALMELYSLIHAYVGDSYSKVVFGSLTQTNLLTTIYYTFDLPADFNYEYSLIVKNDAGQKAVGEPIDYKQLLDYQATQLHTGYNIFLYTRLENVVYGLSNLSNLAEYMLFYKCLPTDLTKDNYEVLTVNLPERFVPLLTLRLAILLNPSINNESIQASFEALVKVLPNEVRKTYLDVIYKPKELKDDIS